MRLSRQGLVDFSKDGRVGAAREQVFPHPHQEPILAAGNDDGFVPQPLQGSLHHRSGQHRLDRRAGEVELAGEVGCREAGSERQHVHARLFEFDEPLGQDQVEGFGGGLETGRRCSLEGRH